MKKILFMLALATMMVACQDKKEELKQMGDTYQARADSLQRIIDEKDGEVNEMMSTLNEIQEGFRLINQAEGRVAVIKDGESTNKAAQIRQSIKNISAAMQHNRELIAKLQKQIRESNSSADKLKETMKETVENLMAQMEEKDNQLKDLRAQLDQKDIHIAELDNTVNNLSTDVSNLKQESENKSQTISTQDKQLNTAYYVFGTKKELQSQNIYQKNKVLQSNFNKNYFTKIDIRVDKEIKLYSKSAKILTAHPTSSYTLTQDANKQYILHITNPQQFWATSKYLVVLVK